MHREECHIVTPQIGTRPFFPGRPVPPLGRSSQTPSIPQTEPTYFPILRLMRRPPAKLHCRPRRCMQLDRFTAACKTRNCTQLGKGVGFSEAPKPPGRGPAQDQVARPSPLRDQERPPGPKGLTKHMPGNVASSCQCYCSLGTDRRTPRGYAASSRFSSFLSSTTGVGRKLLLIRPVCSRLPLRCHASIDTCTRNRSDAWVL